MYVYYKIDFVLNFGTFSKDVVHDNHQDEELYIINEYLDDKYISLANIVKTNGGLLTIPELFNTDMAFYLIRYWGKKILNIFHTLNKLNVSVKYLNLNDLFISNDGNYIKLRPILHYSSINTEGILTTGPDIKIIKSLYTEIETVTNFENYGENIITLIDCFIPPDCILFDKRSKAVDSWLFGNIIYSLLFEERPDSFIIQLKEWIDDYTNLKFEKLTFPNNIINSNFFYFPFRNCSLFDNEGMSYAALSNCVKLKSYSAAIPKKFLNTDEKNDKINGLGLILDLIGSCMNVMSENRTNLSDLIFSDLFTFDNYEILLINKFSFNTLHYYSPELVVINQILKQLRM